MNVFKRATTLVGVVALAASSLLASDSMAQGIGTTITVDNSTPQCETTPSSIQLSQTGGAEALSYGTLTGSGVNFNNKEITGSLYVDMYVNDCVTGWSVTAAITDFSNGTHTVGSAGKVGVYAQSGVAQFDINYTRPVKANGSFSSANWVPGTTGLATSGNGIGGNQFVSAGTGSNLSIMNGTISTGNAESTGEMIQSVKLGLVGVPRTTPAGTYNANLTLTFTPTGP